MKIYTKGTSGNSVTTFVLLSWVLGSDLSFLDPVEMQLRAMGQDLFSCGYVCLSAPALVHRANGHASLLVIQIQYEII